MPQIRASLPFALALIVCGSHDSLAATAEPTEAGFAAKVSPVLKQFCIACHSGMKPKGGLSLDTLTPDFARNAKAWQAVREQLTERTMPPKDKPQPTEAQRRAVLDLLAAIPQAQPAAQGRALLRRLNRIEYNNTIHDLLGIDVDVVELLPEDGSAGGFDNVDVALDLSSALMERYLEAADIVLRAVLNTGPPPKQLLNKRIELVEAAKEFKKKYPTQNLYGQARLEGDHILVLNDQPTPRVLMERVPAAGRYKYRVCAAAVNDKNNQVAARVYAGGLLGSVGRVWLLDVYPMTDQPTEFEFTVALEKLEGVGIAASGVTRQYNLPNGYDGPGLAVYWVEVQGPLAEPNAGQARLFGKVQPGQATRADAVAILRRFTAQAFRRPIADPELEPFLALMDARLKQGAKVEEALRVGLKAVLCSPDFLYLRSTPGRLNDFELASRLSYFLWSTMPDDVLIDLAYQRELGKADILRAQVERMLASPKAHAFTENFTGQWLNLRNLHATDPDAKLYPEFDPLLEYSMPRETHLFFEEILKNDRSLLEFIHADWSMLNGRLAAHYGIAGVKGQEFRKVALPADSHRGGVLTQAGVLKVTANGTTTSPVLRGAWVLDRLIGKPAPPPPSDVPAIEPDVRGATTIRDQLAKHRTLPACASCHERIDPPGFALESFDVIGGWRQRYRVTGSTRYRPTKTLDGRGVYYADGPRVECGDQLADGRRFADIDAFKKLLLEDKDQLARNLASKLLVYATGHGLEPADRAPIENIVAAARAKNFGFRSLIDEIIQSDAFRNK